MKRVFEIEDHAMSVTLCLKTLSIEDLQANDSTVVFNQVLPQLVHQLNAVKEGLLSPFTALTALFSSKEKKVLSHLDAINYIEISQSLVSVPEGFQGKFVDYLKLLESLSTQAYQDANEFIKEYHLLLSSFITNKEDRISAKDLSFYYNRMEQRTLERTKEIAEYFQAPTKLNRVKFQSVVDRLADVQEIDRLAKQIKNQHTTDSLKGIELSVNKIVAMLDIIIHQMKQEDTSKISRQAARNLSEGAYHLARYIEYVSLTHFRTTSMLKIVDDLFVFLNKQVA